MKKYTSLALAISLCTVLTVGCAKSSTDTKGAAETAATTATAAPSNEKPAPAKSDKPITIKWMGPFTSADSSAAGSDKQTEATKLIISDYEKLHPNVKVELVNYVASDNDQKEAYLQARFLGGDGPDIYQNGADAFLADVAKNRWIPLDEMLQEDDPYVAGKKWIDTFDPDAVARSIGYDGQKYPLNITGLGVSLFYNKDMFAKAGVVGEPKTFKELTDAYDKLKAAGMTGLDYSITAGTPQLHWWITVMSSQYWAKTFDPLDIVTKDRALTTDEVIINYKKGTYPNFDWLTENYETFKKLTPYMPKGWEGNLDLDALFTQGKAATYVQTNAFIDTLIDAKVPFQYGTLQMPIVTSESAPNAPGVAVRHTGPWGIAVGIPNYVKKDMDKYNTVVDFLKFFTAPDNISKLAATSHGIVPFVKGATPSAGVEVFTNPDVPLNTVSSPRAEIGIEEKVILGIESNFLTGKDDSAQFKANLKKTYEAAAVELLKKNPKWQEIIDKK